VRGVCGIQILVLGFSQEPRQGDSGAGPHGGTGRTGSPREAPDRLPQPDLSGNRSVPGRPDAMIRARRLESHPDSGFTTRSKAIRRYVGIRQMKHIRYGYPGKAGLRFDFPRN
jgi:hypothetical protein